jgi:hypothetical protein
MRRRIALLCASLLLAGLLAGVASAQTRDIKVVLNGQRITFDQQPFIEEGRTLVPIRAVFAGMGADIGYDDQTRTATVRVGGTTVVVQADNRTAQVNGSPRELDVAARIVNGRIVVPLRFMVEALAGEVHWEDATSTINLGTTPAARAAVQARKAEETLAGDLTARATLTGSFNAVWDVKGERANPGRQVYSVDVMLGPLSFSTAVAVKGDRVHVRDAYGQWKTYGTMTEGFYQAGVPVNPTAMMQLVMSLAAGYSLDETGGGRKINPTWSLDLARQMHDELVAAWPLTGTSTLTGVNGSVTLGQDGAPTRIEFAINGTFSYVEGGQSKTEDWTLGVVANWLPGTPEVIYPAGTP